jgi:hypothetical protein
VIVSPIRSPRNVSTSVCSPGKLPSTSRSSPWIRGCRYAATSGFSSRWQLAPVRPPGVLAALRAPDLLRHRGDRRVREEPLRDPRADAPHLLERRARDRGRLQHEVSFAELREPLAAEAREERRSRGEEDEEPARTRARDARSGRGGAGGSPPGPREEAELPPAFRGLRPGTRHKAARHRERDEERGEHGEEVGLSERREEPALEP